SCSCRAPAIGWKIALQPGLDVLQQALAIHLQGVGVIGASKQTRADFRSVGQPPEAFAELARMIEIAGDSAAVDEVQPETAIEHGSQLALHLVPRRKADREHVVATLVRGSLQLAADEPVPARRAPQPRQIVTQVEAERPVRIAVEEDRTGHAGLVDG